MDKKPEGNKQIQKLLHHMMHSEAFGWPPSCIGPLYQPMRPFEKTLGEDSHAVEPERISK